MSLHTKFVVFKYWAYFLYRCVILCKSVNINITSSWVRPLRDLTCWPKTCSLRQGCVLHTSRQLATARAVSYALNYDLVPEGLIGFRGLTDFSGDVDLTFSII